MHKANTAGSKSTIIVKAILFCSIFTALFIGLSLLKPLFPDKSERLVHAVTGTFAALSTTFLFLKFDKKKFINIGFVFTKITVKNFFAGLLAGLLIMGFLTGIVIITSGFKVVPNANSSFLYFILLTLPLIPLAYMEEVAFRGYPLQLLRSKFSVRSCLLITSLLFALYHIVNGWTIQNSLLGPGSWGIIFGMAAIYSTGISMPTGLHYGVNLTTAAFGTDDSSFNMWILQQRNGQTLDTYKSSELEILLPQISILVFAIILLELFVRRKS